MPTRPPIPEAAERPLAVGLFGYSYGGKGFELLEALRQFLPSEIALHVAGRGTHHLRLPKGVMGWGAIDREREQEFFASVRCVLLPYERGGRYGAFESASGAAARAFAWATPVVTTPVRGFVEEASLSRAVTLAAGAHPEMLARSAEALIRDPMSLQIASGDLRRLRCDRAPERVAQRMLDAWRQLAAHSGEGAA